MRLTAYISKILAIEIGPLVEKQSIHQIKYSKYIRASFISISYLFLAAAVYLYPII